MMKQDYGQCPKCGSNLEPIWFVEEEMKIAFGHMYRTGRKRRAVSHLECPDCWEKLCVDDTFDGDWYRG